MEQVSPWEQARRNISLEAKEKGFAYGSEERRKLFKEKYFDEYHRLLNLQREGKHEQLPMEHRR